VAGVDTGTWADVAHIFLGEDIAFFHVSSNKERSPQTTLLGLSRASTGILDNAKGSLNGAAIVNHALEVIDFGGEGGVWTVDRTGDSDVLLNETGT